MRIGSVAACKCMTLNWCYVQISIQPSKTKTQNLYSLHVFKSRDLLDGTPEKYCYVLDGTPEHLGPSILSNQWSRSIQIYQGPHQVRNDLNLSFKSNHQINWRLPYQPIWHFVSNNICLKIRTMSGRIQMTAEQIDNDQVENHVYCEVDFVIIMFMTQTNMMPACLWHGSLSIQARMLDVIQTLRSSYDLKVQTSCR